MLIEGIDDSIIYTTVILSIIIYLLYSFLKRSFIPQNNRPVHVDSLDHVNQTRELLNSNEATRRTTTNNTQNIQCPICLDIARLVVETNCGHLFCANCIIQYWQTSTGNILIRQMNCPLCRQLLICLLPIFSQEELNLNENSQQIVQLVNNYNRRFSGAPRSLIDYIYDLPTLLRHAINELFSLNSLAYWYRIRVICIFILALMYLLSPLDIIPETLFGIFGFFDDIIILFFFAIYVSIIFRQFIANRNT